MVVLHSDLHDALSLHYGNNGYLCKALQDLDAKKHASHAVTLVQKHGPVRIEGDVSSTTPHMHAWQTISNMLSDTYTSFVDTLKGVAWRIIVEAGKIPADLDTLISNLRLVITEPVKRALNWIGRFLKPIWDYFLQLLPSAATLTNFLNAVSFDWFVSNVTSGVAYVASQTASYLVLVFQALRSLIYGAIEQMGAVVEGVMDAVHTLGVAIFPTCYRTCVKSVYMVMSGTHDLLRYASSPHYMGISRLDAFKTNIGNVCTQVVSSFRNDLDAQRANRNVAEDGIRESDFFKNSFGLMFDVGESIVTWIQSFYAWLPTALKRLASSARSAYSATMGFMLLFHKMCGGIMQEVAEELTSTKDVTNILQVRDSMDTLLQQGDAFSEETRQRLQESVELADEVLNLTKAQNDQFLEKLKGKPHKDQYAHNELLANVLTTLTVDADTFDQEAVARDVNRIIKTYTGEDVPDTLMLHTYTLSHLEAVYAMAMSEILEPQMPVGAGIFGDGDETDDGDVLDGEEVEKAMEQLNKESIKYPKGIRSELIKYEQQFQKARIALDTYEKQMGLIRNQTYVDLMERLRQGYVNGKRFQMTQADFGDMAMIMANANGIHSQDEHVLLIRQYIKTYVRRQKYAKKLKTQLAVVNRKKAILKWTGRLLVFAVPVLIVTLITYKTEGIKLETLQSPTDIFQPNDPGPSEESAFDTDPITRFFLQLLKWTRAKWDDTVTPVNYVGTLNAKTWDTFARHFMTDWGITKIFDYPLLLRYLGSLFFTVPVTVALGLWSYATVYLSGSLVLDWWYGVGGEMDAQGRETSDVFMFYWKRFQTSTFSIMSFVIFSVVNFWLVNIGSQIGVMKGVITSFGGSLSLGIYGLLRPMASYTEGLIMGLPAQVSEDTIEQFLRRLVPSRRVRDKILSFELAEKDSRDTIKEFRNMGEALLADADTNKTIQGVYAKQALQNTQANLTGALPSPQNRGFATGSLTKPRPGKEKEETSTFNPLDYEDIEF